MANPTQNPKLTLADLDEDFVKHCSLGEGDHGLCENCEAAPAEYETETMAACCEQCLVEDVAYDLGHGDSDRAVRRAESGYCQ